MTSDPKVIGDQLRALYAQAATDLVLEINANLIEECPVDTGNARANFIPSIGVPHQGEERGAGAQEAGTAAVVAYKFGDGDIHITNHVAYIGPLLAGHSPQAAPGWDLAAIDKASQTIGQRYAIEIELGTGAAVVERGGYAAENLASAYSPFGDD